MTSTLRRMAVVAAALVALGACGGDDSSPTTVATTATTTAGGSTPGSASPELCTARDDLRQSIEGLADIDVVANGTNAITDAISAIRDDLVAVRDATGDDLRPQVTAFEDALGALQSAVSDTDAAGAASAAADVARTGATLVGDLGRLDCP